MKPPRDPPRLLDPGSDAPAWLRSSLEAGTRDVAGPERLARIAARLPLGGLPGAPAAAPSIPPVLSGAVIGAALGLAVMGAGWVASPRAADPRPPARPAMSATFTPAVPEPPRSDPASTPSPRPRASSRRAEPLPGATAGPAASVALDPPSPAAAGPKPEPPVAETEAAILARAQDALSGSPARALALTDLHLARYPGGRLVQDREVIAVAALLRLGRTAEARARARSFVAAFPASADRRRLGVLIPDLESSDRDHKDSSDRPSTP